MCPRRNRPAQECRGAVISYLHQSVSSNPALPAVLARPLRTRPSDIRYSGGFDEASRIPEIDDRARGGQRAAGGAGDLSPAKAQSRQETLLIVSESGPNNIDIHGVGTNVPGYEVSWNCYDRLISHEMKTVNGTQYYDRDKFKMELADDMNVGDMSATFKLKKNATFHDGTPVTAKDVKWSLDRAVTVGGFPTFQMGAGSLTKAEQFVVVDDNTVRVDFLRKDRLTIPDLAVIVPGDLQLRAGQEERHREGPVGPRIHQAEHRRQRRLPRRELERRHRGRARAQRQMDRRTAAEGAARRLAHGAVGRQPPRAARARRRRHLLRSAEQGLRRAQGRAASSASSRRRTRTASSTSA